ncbi:hypothetical protein NKR23_g4173 [Pleurostoma richardsiae]|uniref:Uncharacterized protein n=1 Tax=Pleurostoma richardsiae TaxID=41990 RepID=A0AA38RJL4_9PEZI|nr:hypothetical protein NKR23_g4173 [Pleurostoma richardsiae]
MLPLLLLLPVFAAASPALERRACGDNCARAVIALAYTTRHGAADCSSYLLTTVTPATSTITQTSTLSFSPTVTVAGTNTVTATTTIPFTAATVTAPIVTTTTVTSTSTIFTNWPGLGTTVYKRDQIAAPSIIPAYASPCSGAARYSTACACVGVYPSTVTAATPLTTITVYVSASYTATVTSIAATAADVVTASSSDIATVTTISTTTVTAATVASTTVPAFRLQVATGTYAGQYVALDTSFPNDETTVDIPLIVTTDESSIALWTVNTETNTLINLDRGLPLYTCSGGCTFPPVRVMDSDTVADSDGYADTTVCSVSTSGGLLFLNCAQPDHPSYNAWSYGATSFGFDFILTSPAYANNFGYQGATLQLIEI